MIKENIVKKIENNNLTEEEKKEVIQIIELYHQNKIQEALIRLIKCIQVSQVLK